MSQVQIVQHVNFADLFINALNLIVVHLQDLQLLQTVDGSWQCCQPIMAQVESGQSGEFGQRVWQRLQLVVVQVQYEQRTKI